jgi:hypothetical protein
MHCEAAEREEPENLYLHESALQPGEAVLIWWRENEFNRMHGTFHGVQEPGGAFLVFLPGRSEPEAFPFYAVVRTFRRGDRIKVLAPTDNLEAHEFDGRMGTYQNLAVSDAGGVRMRILMDESPDGALKATCQNLRRCAVLPAAGPFLARMNKVGSPVV